jgi:NAD(P)-dependent dehydrogenase (short-subunit alcohol dehydrogenase family)
MSLILISGANSQIGSYLAKMYEAEGRSLLLLYHNRQERLVELRSSKIAVDLMDYEAVAGALEAYIPKISGVIHCAAVRSEDHLALADTQPETFRRVFEHNVYPAYNLLRLILPALRERAYGRVVLFSSDVSINGLPKGSAYAAAKAAIANLAKSAAQENAEFNVLINSIAPGPVETALEQDYSEEYLKFRQSYFAKHIAGTATGKLVSKEEIKVLTDMLLSPLLMNLCGEEIVLNGGKK